VTYFGGLYRPFFPHLLPVPLAAALGCSRYPCPSLPESISSPVTSSGEARGGLAARCIHATPPAARSALVSDVLMRIRSDVVSRFSPRPPRLGSTGGSHCLHRVRHHPRLPGGAGAAPSAPQFASLPKPSPLRNLHLHFGMLGLGSLCGEHQPASRHNCQW